MLGTLESAMPLFGTKASPAALRAQVLSAHQIGSCMGVGYVQQLWCKSCPRGPLHCHGVYSKLVVTRDGQECLGNSGESLLGKGTSNVVPSDSGCA